MDTLVFIVISKLPVHPVWSEKKGHTISPQNVTGEGKSPSGKSRLVKYYSLARSIGKYTNPTYLLDFKPIAPVSSGRYDQFLNHCPNKNNTELTESPTSSNEMPWGSCPFPQQTSRHYDWDGKQKHQETLIEQWKKPGWLGYIGDYYPLMGIIRSNF